MRERKHIDLTKRIEIQQVIGSNLTNSSFYIPRADISVSIKDSGEDFLASIRFAAPDTFNISIRAFVGIEIARVFITRDTVLVNDRINRILYYGKPDNLLRKYGLQYAIIPLIFGDYVSGSQVSFAECVDGLAEVKRSSYGTIYNYRIDCDKKKVVNAKQENSIGRVVNELIFNRFIKVDEILVPSEVLIDQPSTMTSAKIEFKRIERPGKGNVLFIPGNKYTLVELK